MSSNQTICLRVSIARIAQAMGVDIPHLKITGKGFSELVELADRENSGWNVLATECINHYQEQTKE